MTRLANWWQSLRRDGVVTTMQRFIRRFVDRSYRCLVTYSAVAGPRAPDHVGAITFRVATRSDLDRLEEFEG